MSKIKYLKVSSLRLHDENPRLKDRTPGRTQKQLAKELIHYKIKNFREANEKYPGRLYRCKCYYSRKS